MISVGAEVFGPGPKEAFGGRAAPLSFLERPAVRRDQIVKYFDELIKAKGEAAVLYDLPAR